MPPHTAIIGGGLAGSEAARQLADRNERVTIFEMKPNRFSPAHTNPDLGELVCSNSFRSDDPLSAVGLLKEEMRSLDSLVLEAADRTRIPAGKALAVDRERFAGIVSERLQEQRNVTIVRKEILGLDDPALTPFERVVFAAGPLAGESLTRSLQQQTGEEGLSFYDAIAPIVSADSIDQERVFRASRYDPESTDYLNCPLDKEEYERFRQALLHGKQARARDFESQTHFEGCLPVEVLAERGEMTLAFGPLKPVGLTDPRTGERPFAVVQLRAENKEKTMFNLVGFQTRLTHSAQKQIFRLIPGLEDARFERLGSMHRNTFVHAPRVLTPDLELRKSPGVYLAGQITGVEGYVESAACGLWLGLYLAGKTQGLRLDLPPRETALGGLLNHLQADTKNFQPMNVNFGLCPPLEVRAKKSRRKELYVHRARQAWQRWREEGRGNL
ncbi:MAG: methylenetetrahydrofolate--tRNA-(uracil(54)-C(5))-methyltransferase (FADH(2)-oxidizing) TrmFO [Desulfohalobiaceae bacterium]|nr:methylenetetrahydrofolate--tRNA-(uracil(54)-C(5))-methyltransferase (FADH(2)-oxidizing) TrmFO [Desulfohalobiaceae bacterium]